MNKDIQGQDTRNDTKDKFQTNREQNMTDFLNNLNQGRNTYFNNPPNNYITNPIEKPQQNLDYFSSIQNNIEKSFKKDETDNKLNQNANIPNYSQISSTNFNKMVSNNYNTFENFIVPQSTTGFISSDIKLKEIENKIDPINIKNDRPKEIHKGVLENSSLLQDTKSIIIPNTAPEIDRTQSYMAEIGEKRQLSNIIYNSLLRTYSSINNNTVTEFQIQELLERENINDSNDKQKIKSFVTNLKLLINKNVNISSHKNIGIISDDCLFEKETKNMTYYLLLDTNDRDMQTWPDINKFGFSFGGHNVFSKDTKNVGYIERNFSNVRSAELIELIIPRLTEGGDNYQLYPYLLLDIEEFGNIYQGTNQHSSSAFGKISFDKTIGNYAYYSSPENNHLIKYFNPRISLNKITIKIRKPDGNLFNFGKYIIDPSTNSTIIIDSKPVINVPVIEDETYREILESCDEIKEHIKEIKLESNISISFKLVCIQRSLETMFLNKK